jgi:hypothetical protein
MSAADLLLRQIEEEILAWAEDVAEELPIAIPNDFRFGDARQIIAAAAQHNRKLRDLVREYRKAKLNARVFRLLATSLPPAAEAAQVLTKKAGDV